MFHLSFGFAREPPTKKKQVKKSEDKSEEKGKRRKKSLQFSKAWLIGCITISLVYTTLSYVLAFLDKSTVESLSMTIIETLWNTTGGSFAAYALQNCVRAVAQDFGLKLKPLQEGGESNGVVQNSGFSSFGSDDHRGSCMGP